LERTAQYISDLPPHPSVSVFQLNFPTTRASILQNFRVHVDTLSSKVQAKQREICDGTKLKIVAVIDSIVSNPGVHLPWKEMVAICRERGILTIVDAAHSVGQEPNINLKEADPDFWISVRVSLYWGVQSGVELSAHRTVTSGCTPNVLAPFFTCPNGTLHTS
jgi:selenocysteine lyase/cysteine desulfurase